MCDWAALRVLHITHRVSRLLVRVLILKINWLLINMTRVFCTINPFCIKDWSSCPFFIRISIAVVTTDVQIEFGLRSFDFNFKRHYYSVWFIPVHKKSFQNWLQLIFVHNESTYSSGLSSTHLESVSIWSWISVSSFSVAFWKCTEK